MLRECQCGGGEKLSKKNNKENNTSEGRVSATASITDTERLWRENLLGSRNPFIMLRQRDAASYQISHPIGPVLGDFSLWEPYY